MGETRERHKSGHSGFSFPNSRLSSASLGTTRIHATEQSPAGGSSVPWIYFLPPSLRSGGVEECGECSPLSAPHKKLHGGAVQGKDTSVGMFHILWPMLGSS